MGFVGVGSMCGNVSMPLETFPELRPQGEPITRCRVGYVSFFAPLLPPCCSFSNVGKSPKVVWNRPVSATYVNVGFWRW